MQLIDEISHDFTNLFQLFPVVLNSIKNEYLQKVAKEVDTSKNKLWDYSGCMAGQNYPGKKLAK